MAPRAETAPQGIRARPRGRRRHPVGWSPQSEWARGVARVLVRPNERAEVYELLADKVTAGHKLRDAVEQEAHWMALDSRWDMRAIMLRHVMERMDEGEPFHRAMSGYARDTEQLILSAMDTVRDYGGILRETSRSLTVAESIKAQYLKMATIPAIAVPAIAGILILLAVKLIPTLENSLPPEQWSGTAAILRGIANFMLTPWAPVSLLVVLALSAVSLFSLPRWTGRVRVWAERLPPWNAYKSMVGAEWLIMLGGMLASGHKLVESLEHMQQSARPWLRERVDAILDLVHAGTKFGVALHRCGYDFPSREVVRVLASSAELPNFDEILVRTGERWLQQSQKIIAARVARTTSLAIIAVYLVIAIVIVGVLSMVSSIVGNTMSHP
jgi:type II secretory pathway component PulF